MNKILDDVDFLYQKMHTLNISHGDLHPGNIFYTKSGIIAVGDYGYSIYTNSRKLKE